MKTCPLLHKVCHRAIIMPVTPQHTRLIHINPSYWRIYCSFEIILKWELSIGSEFNQCSMQIHSFKKTFNLK